jgi:DNA-binding CsgD family transcriptional regulator
VSSVRETSLDDDAIDEVLTTLFATESVRLHVDLSDTLLRRGVLATLSSLHHKLVLVDASEPYDVLISDRAPNGTNTLVVTTATTPDQLITAVITATRHPLAERHTPELSSREIEILALVARGLTNTDIAETCFIAPNTVKTHLARIFTKLGTNDRAAAVFRAANLGLLSVAVETPVR